MGNFKEFLESSHDIDFYVIRQLGRNKSKVVDMFTIFNCPFALARRIANAISKVPNYSCLFEVIEED